MRRRARAPHALCAGLLLIGLPLTTAASLRGAVGIETRGYLHAPAFPDQNRDRLQESAYLELDWSGEARDGLRFDLDVFGRVAPQGSDEIFADLRQATVQWQQGQAEWKLGVLAETWGVLEAWNPVDIVNQRDFAEDFQGEAKLGQPGATLALQGERATLAVYALTGSRARRFAEGPDRLRALPAPVLDEQFEDGRWVLGGAARAQFRLGALDLALSHYQGHAREPLLLPRFDSTSLLGFDAVYERIGQSGVEAQFVTGDSVFKSELIYQYGGADAFWGSGTGVETSFSKFAGGAGDLALYAEYYRDWRNATAPVTPFQHDLFLGARYTCNDAADTVLEFRSTYDLDYHSNLLELRANRRVLGDAVISLAWIKPFSAESDPALRGIARDDHLKLGFAWYF